VKEYEGTVERIDLRATHLRAPDNRLVIIPNADLYTATVTNNTASPCRRQEFVFGIAYEADLARARELAQQVATETPEVLPEPAPDVLVDALAAGSVQLKLRFYTDPHRRNALIVGSEVRRRLVEAFAAAEIAIYPSGVQAVELRTSEERGGEKQMGLRQDGGKDETD
jgi:small-conductance mechanosensitive channel